VNKEEGKKMEQESTPQKADIRLLAAGAIRSLGHVDTPLIQTLPDPALSALLDVLPKPEEISGVLLSGGEPTLRKDLPNVLSEMAERLTPRLGMATDGLILSSDKSVQFLMDKGLKRVRIGFHSGRTDAHDWVVGLQGAAKRVHKSIRMCVEAGLEVEIETLVTRPTASYLEETIELLARLRVNRIILRRLSGRNNAADHFIAASPRLGPSQTFLEGALRIAEGWGIETMLQDFPGCAVHAESSSFLLDSAERWVAPRQEEWESLVEHFSLPKRVRGCRECPRDETCQGAPEDYIHLFDRLELNAKSSMPTGKGVIAEDEAEWAKTRLSQTPPAPPARAGRTPATRLTFIQRQGKRDLHGDPMFGVPIHQLPDAVSEAFLSSESKRKIRVRLVRKSQEGVETLRIAPPSLQYPEIGALLRDVTRLSFPKVEICGDGAGLKDVPDVDLRRLRRRVSKFDIALLGPDEATHDQATNTQGSFEDSMNSVKRLKSFARIQAGAYGIISDDSELKSYHDAWESGELPGQPGFRLSADGGNLDDLVSKAKKLDESATRDAIASHIPVCLMARGKHIIPQKSWDEVHGDVLERPEHHWRDRIGQFDSCILAGECTAKDRCPGIARGWKSNSIVAKEDTE